MNDHMRNLRLVHSDAWLIDRQREDIESEVPAFDAAVQALLKHGRIVVPLSPGVRARALARARAALAARAR
jgi:hypothetical protein